MNKNYCIKPFYRTRTHYHHFDDSAMKDEWQLEVYLYALGLMKKHQLKSVVDLGCGSAYKLITYLGEYDTLGLELPENIDLLNQKYPERQWGLSDFSVDPGINTDLIICSDVIEHIVDPDDLLDYIKSMTFKYLIISTPDRGLLYRPWSRGNIGPPSNKAHVREWAFEELAEYISKHFNVIDHRVTNMHQATQMIVCQK